MRAKIILVFAIVVVVVGGLSFAVMRATLGDASNREEAPRAVTAAVTQLEVEGLRVERWLASQATSERAPEPFLAGTPSARSKTATEFADSVNEHFKRDSVAAISPALVVVVDLKGEVIGRNGSGLMRGQNLGERYPDMLEAFKAGRTGSDVWVTPAKNEQLLASYAPIRGAKGEVLGGVAVGTPLSDERLGQTVGRTTGGMLIAAVPSGDGFELLAKSNGVTPELVSALQAEEATRAVRQAQDAAGVVDLAGLPPDFFGAARRLSGYGDGKRAVILSVTKARIVGSWGSLLFPALGVILLGLIITVVCGYLLDNYISRPISDLEDGLLAIINGQRDIRFELEHALYGGLVFRINSLLNELLGIQEDTTDAEGRVSMPPSSQRFSDAVDVNDRVASTAGAASGDVAALRTEPEDAYHLRMFEEYRAAKSSLGDPVDHVTLHSFTERLQTSAQQMMAKHNKAYRFKIEVDGKEVVLVPVALE